MFYFHWLRLSLTCPQPLLRVRFFFFSSFGLSGVLYGLHFFPDSPLQISEGAPCLSFSSHLENPHLCLPKAALAGGSLGQDWAKRVGGPTGQGGGVGLSQEVAELPGMAWVSWLLTATLWVAWWADPVYSKKWPAPASALRKWPPSPQFPCTLGDLLDGARRMTGRVRLSESASVSLSSGQASEGGGPQNLCAPCQFPAEPHSEVTGTKRLEWARKWIQPFQQSTTAPFLIPDNHLLPRLQLPQVRSGKAQDRIPGAPRWTSMKATTSLSPSISALLPSSSRPSAGQPAGSAPMVGPQCPHPDGGKFESLRLRCCWLETDKGPCLSERVCLPGVGGGGRGLGVGGVVLGVGGVRGRAQLAQPSARKLLPLKLPGGPGSLPLLPFLPPSLTLPAPSPLSPPPLAYPPARPPHPPSCRLPLSLSPELPRSEQLLSGNTTHHRRAPRDWRRPSAAMPRVPTACPPPGKPPPHKPHPVPTIPYSWPGTALALRSLSHPPDAPTLHPPNSPSSSLPLPLQTPLPPSPPPPRRPQGCLQIPPHPTPPPRPLLQDPSMPLHGHPAVLLGPSLSWPLFLPGSSRHLLHPFPLPLLSLASLHIPWASAPWPSQNIIKSQVRPAPPR